MHLTIAQKQNYLYFLMLLAAAFASLVIYHFLKDEWLSFKTGEDYFNDQNYKEAIKFYRRSLEEGPTDPNIFLHLADSYVAEGKFSESIEWYTKYLQVFPHDLEAHHSLAKALSWSGEIKEAEKEYHFLLKKHQKEHQIEKKP